MGKEEHQQNKSEVRNNRTKYFKKKGIGDLNERLVAPSIMNIKKYQWICQHGVFGNLDN